MMVINSNEKKKKSLFFHYYSLFTVIVVNTSVYFYYFQFPLNWGSRCVASYAADYIVFYKVPTFVENLDLFTLKKYLCNSSFGVVLYFNVFGRIIGLINLWWTCS